jgi:hypothetical protein
VGETRGEAKARKIERGKNGGAKNLRNRRCMIIYSTNQHTRDHSQHTQDYRHRNINQLH